MKMSRLLKDIEEFLKGREDLVKNAQPEHEKTSANQEDPENANQDESNGSEVDDTPVKASGMEDSFYLLYVLL